MPAACGTWGDLVNALSDLFIKRVKEESLRRVLIETTGLADPPIIHTLMTAPLCQTVLRWTGSSQRWMR